MSVTGFNRRRRAEGIYAPKSNEKVEAEVAETKAEVAEVEAEVEAPAKKKAKKKRASK